MIRFMLTILCAMVCSAASGQIVVEVIPPIEVTVQEPLEDFVLVFCTADYCGPCRVFKSSAEYRRIQRRLKLEIADIDERPAWKAYATRVPTFWLIRKSDRARLKSWEGTITLRQVEEQVRLIRVTPVQVRRRSQSELIQVHNTFHGGGMWTWPGDLRTHLKQMHRWEE